MRPPSYETFTPPSLPSMMRCGSCSSHQIVLKSPNTPRKNWQFQVLPPSVDSYIESLVTTIWSGIRGVGPDLIERVRGLRSGDVDVVAVRLPPRPSAVLASIDLVADRSAGLRCRTATLTCSARVHPGRHAGGARVQVLDDDGQQVRIAGVEIEADSADIAGRQARRASARSFRRRRCDRPRSPSRRARAATASGASRTWRRYSVFGALRFITRSVAPVPSST